MAKCTACGRFVAAKEVAACCTCNNKYHFTCVQLQESPKAKNEWQCQSCKKMRLQRKPIEDDCGGTPSSSASTVASFEDAPEHGSVLLPGADLNQQLKMLMDELRSMKEEIREELREIRREVAELCQSVATCNKRVDSLESRVTALECRQEDVASEGLLGKLEQTVTHLKTELNDREQELLSADLEISNLPEDKGENVIHVVELVAKKLGVSLEARDVVFAERVGPKPHQAEGETSGASAAAGAATGGGAGDRPRRLVVRLARRQLRDEPLRSARTTTTDDLGLAAPPRRFYLNERLTRVNRQLFYRARRAAERLGWRYTWTKRGRIFTKQGDGKRTVNIRSDADLERVFGLDPLKDNSIN